MFLTLGVPGWLVYRCDCGCHGAQPQQPVYTCPSPRPAIGRGVPFEYRHSHLPSPLYVLLRNTSMLQLIGQSGGGGHCGCVGVRSERETD